MMSVHSGEDAGATRTARRGGDVSPRKASSFVEYPGLGAGHVIYGVKTLVIAEDEEDIWTCRLRCGGGRGRQRGLPGDERNKSGHNCRACRKGLLGLIRRRRGRSTGRILRRHAGDRKNGDQRQDQNLQFQVIEISEVLIMVSLRGVLCRSNLLHGSDEIASSQKPLLAMTK